MLRLSWTVTPPNRRRNMHKLKVVLASFALAAAVPAHANLLVNGGFESNVIASGSYGIFATLTGWSGLPDIELQNRVAGNPFEGNQFVELDSTRNSGMAQDFATTAGASYAIHFDYSPRPGIAASSNGIEFLWNGLVLSTLAFNGIGNGDTVWSSHDFTGVAAGATSRVEFRAIGTSDSLGGYIDNVSVAAIPEPMTMSLMFFGAAAVLGLVRRRKPADADA
jgi:hypothetical protein